MSLIGLETRQAVHPRCEPCTEWHTCFGASLAASMSWGPCSSQPPCVGQDRGPVDLQAAGQAVHEQLGSQDWDLAEIERQKLAQVLALELGA